ncbi:hypothetical protein EYF80_040145 [Liparis tanakae]|uniref:Uncharacterized protein n=1 Tax=Liparis tanakae TaxID=230148 RepID=A0A4Z2G7W3_9TELE|nr:hypothetical protein EYF80_040145 [Liparis tanakae]
MLHEKEREEEEEEGEGGGDEESLKVPHLERKCGEDSENSRAQKEADDMESQWDIKPPLRKQLQEVVV